MHALKRAAAFGEDCLQKRALMLSFCSSARNFAAICASCCSILCLVYSLSIYLLPAYVIYTLCYSVTMLYTACVCCPLITVREDPPESQPSAVAVAISAQPSAIRRRRQLVGLHTVDAHQTVPVADLLIYIYIYIYIYRERERDR